MNKLINFVIGTSTTFILIAKDTISDIPPNWFELIKLLCSIFGGVLATLLMNILKKWFKSSKDVELINKLNDENFKMSKTLERLGKVIDLKDFQINIEETTSKSQPKAYPENKD